MQTTVIGWPVLKEATQRSAWKRKHQGSPPIELALKERCGFVV
jgi:hypothetical protein